MAISNKTLATLVGAVLVISVISLGMTAMNIIGKVSATGAITGTTSVTVMALTQISLPTAAVNFGSMYQGSSNDTSDDNPLPFVVQNDGTVKVNVTVGATDIFATQPNPSVYYRFSVNSSTEGTCYAPDSITAYTNMPITASPAMAMSFLNNTDTCDTAQLEINVTVPVVESVGAKTSTVTFLASQS